MYIRTHLSSTVSAVWKVPLNIFGKQISNGEADVLLLIELLAGGVPIVFWQPLCNSMISGTGAPTPFVVSLFSSYALQTTIIYLTQGRFSYVITCVLSM